MDGQTSRGLSLIVQASSSQKEELVLDRLFSRKFDFLLYEMPHLRWGIVGCGQISFDFVQSMRKCVNPNMVRLMFCRLTPILGSGYSC